VSKVRLEQTIYAEYLSLKVFIQNLAGEKTEQKVETLSDIWKETAEETKSIAQKLVGLDFSKKEAIKTI
jgi:hypothetical protein